MGRSDSPVTFSPKGQQLRWLLGVRFGVLGISLVATLASLAILDRGAADLASRLLWPLLAFLVLSSASWWWVRHRGESSRFVYGQLAVDIALVTGIVYVTGGAISPFLFLYLPVVMVAALLGTRRVALITAIASSLAYTALATSLKVGALSAFDGTPSIETPSGGLILQVIGLASAMVLIAVATSYLVQTILLRDAQVEQSRKDLASITEKQRLLIETLPECVCVLDRSGLIITTNPHAEMLFGALLEALRRKPLVEALRALDPDLNVSVDGEHFTGDCSLPVTANTPERRVSFSARALPIEGGHVVMFKDVTELRSVEEQLELQDRMARLLSSAYQPPDESRETFGDFVGESKVMQKVFALISRVASSDATVLVHGESGTGKELVARAIHRKSQRKAQSFVAVNCGAIPEALLESEFFGHKKGAFTGAHADHSGLFQRAAGGTLFLDEIGELPLLMQTKLLRALQERMVRPVGGDRDLPVDVRIVAATNKNLKREVEQGRFREDLYYRLNVISISLPPLRERKEDIPLLVNSFLQRLMAERRKGSAPGESLIGERAAIPPLTMQLLVNYSYPGNVRELENIIERAFVLGGAVILPEHLPDSVRAEEPALVARAGGETTIIIDESISFPVDLDMVLGGLERRYLEGALRQTGGLKKKAAELLGINFRSMRYRLQKYGLNDEHDNS